MDLEQNIFLSNVKWLRKHHNPSKKQMSALLGISVYSLRKIENGILPTNVDVSIFFKIHRQFGICPTEQLTILLENTLLVE